LPINGIKKAKNASAFSAFFLCSRIKNLSFLNALQFCDLRLFLAAQPEAAGILSYFKGFGCVAGKRIIAKPV
jgi:hypothetical protein